MYDSYGDGWNGNTLVIGDASYTMDSGSGLDINVGCDTEEEEEEGIVEEEICEGITVTCDGGDWQSEVEWGIYTCDGELMLSGGAPYSECIDGLPDVFNIAMFDSYGDGWNGNTLVIGDVSYTIESGSENFANVGCETEEEEEEIVEEEKIEG